MTKQDILQRLAALPGRVGCYYKDLTTGESFGYRAEELFARPEGKELLRKWGLPEAMRGVGNCILGYAEGEAPAPKPRKEGRIVRV